MSELQGRANDGRTAASGLSRRSFLGSTWAAPFTIATTAAPHRAAASANFDGVLSDLSFDSLDAAVAALEPGGVLEIRRTHSRTRTLVVDKPCTLQFSGDGSLNTDDPDLTLITVSSDDVQLRSPRIVGAGTSKVGTGRGIHAHGTVTRRWRNLLITDPLIENLNYIGIETRLMDTVQVFGGEIRDVGYAGVMLLSTDNARVTGVHIHDVVQTPNYQNSYGVAVTHWDATEPPSRNCAVESTLIERVPWEGLDSHGGLNLRFSGNTVTACGVAIAIVGGPGPVACEDALILGNTIDYVAPGGSRSGGIVFTGTSSGPGEPATTLASGVISGNTVARSGRDSSANGGIVLYNTRSVTVAGNRIIEPAANGIVLNYNNFDFCLSSNSVVDVWSSSILTSAIYVGEHSNTGMIQSNTLGRAAKRAERINEFGLRVHASARPGSISVGPNNWKNAGTPLSDENDATELGSPARRQTIGAPEGRLGFFGEMPAERPRITGSRSGEAEASASTRAALVALGLAVDETTP